jgi:hypothetical protein
VKKEKEERGSKSVDTAVTFHFSLFRFSLCGSRFWRWRRQVSCFDGRLKSIAGVSAVAKRLVCRIPAAAKRNHLASSKTVSVSGGIFNNDAVASYTKRAVVDAVYCYIVFIAHQIVSS